jgi:adenylylsulfate kinase
MDNLQRHNYRIQPEDRARLMGHPPMLLWFTGLSGSGKSTIADAMEAECLRLGIHAASLDGDAMRMRLSADLGFTEADRDEHLRRVGEVASLMLDAGLVVLAAFVSPLKSQRLRIREVVGENRFMEIYVNTPLEVCEQRDIKGLYKKARAGEIAHFTGVSAPYEAPEFPDVTLDTSTMNVDQSIEALKFVLRIRGFQL